MKSAMKFCRTFAEKAWKQLGGRVYIFWGCRDEDGTLSASKFDFNAELGMGRSYRDVIDDGSLSDLTWGKYLQQCYDGNDKAAENDIVVGGHRNSPMDLDTRENGEPILPEPESWPSDVTGEVMIRWLKKLLRSFVGMHYCESDYLPSCPTVAHIFLALATDGRTSRVPWADVVKDQATFIDEEYLPDYQTLDAEPSHLAIQKVKTLLNFWIQRQRAGQTVFRFRLVIQGTERVPAKAPDVRTNMQKPTRRSRAKGNLKRQVRRSNEGELRSDEEIDDPLKQKVKGQKGKGTVNRKGKKGKKSAEMVDDSGEEFDLLAMDDLVFSDDDVPLPNSLDRTAGRGMGSGGMGMKGPRVGGTTTTKGPRVAETTVVGTTDGAHSTTTAYTLPAPTIGPTTLQTLPPPHSLASADKALWNRFVAHLPLDCVDWSEEQAIGQFRVFQRWSSAETNGVLAGAALYTPPSVAMNRDVADPSPPAGGNDSPKTTEPMSPKVAEKMPDLMLDERTTAGGSTKPGERTPEGATPTLADKETLALNHSLQNNSLIHNARVEEVPKRGLEPSDNPEGQDIQMKDGPPAKRARTAVKPTPAKPTRSSARTNAPGPSIPLTRSKAKRGGKRK